MYIYVYVKYFRTVGPYFICMALSEEGRKERDKGKVRRGKMGHERQREKSSSFRKMIEING